MFLGAVPTWNWLLLLLLPAAPPATGTRSLHFMTEFDHYWPFSIFQTGDPSNETTTSSNPYPLAHRCNRTQYPTEPAFFYSARKATHEDQKCQRTHRLHPLLQHLHPGRASLADRARSAANSERWCNACCSARTAFIANERASSSTLGKEGTTVQRCKQRRGR